MMKKTSNSNRPQNENQANIHFLPWKISPPLKGIDLFFTTRQGGISQGGYESFNLGGHVNDSADHVAENRARLLASLPLGCQELAIANQVHGTQTVIAGWQGPPPNADAVITNQPGLAVGVLTADCAPVLFADPKARVIGAAHAGWRGALGGVLENCLDAMEDLGATREEMIAIIGPTIGPTAYEVDRAFYNHLLHAPENKLNEGCQKFFSAERNACILKFNLPGYVQARLLNAGMNAFKIIHLEQCTYVNESLFFSHRRAVHHGQTPCGRQMAGIFLL